MRRSRKSESNLIGRLSLSIRASAAFNHITRQTSPSRYALCQQDTIFCGTTSSSFRKSRSRIDSLYKIAKRPPCRPSSQSLPLLALSRSFASCKHLSNSSTSQLISFLYRGFILTATGFIVGTASIIICISVFGTILLGGKYRQFSPTIEC